MEREAVEEVWAFESRCGPRSAGSARRTRVERAAWFGALAGLICIVPGFAAYLARHSALLPSMVWAQLFVEMTTFSIFVGVVHSSAIALGLSLGQRPRARLAGGMAMGALSGALVGAIGAMHFGRMKVPYFGGGTLYATVGVGVLVFAVCHARSEAADARWATAVRCTLLPVPVLAAVLGLCGLIAPSFVRLDYGAFRLFVQAAGLPALGALAGSLGGAMIGAWTTSGVLLTAQAVGGERAGRA